MNLRDTDDCTVLLDTTAVIAVFTRSGVDIAPSRFERLMNSRGYKKDARGLWRSSDVEALFVSLRSKQKR